MAEKLNTGAASYNRGKQLEIVLGPERAQEIRNRLLQGEQVKDLVPLLQTEWGLFSDKKSATVQTMLYRYSREVVKKETVRRVMDTVEQRGHVAVTTLEDLSSLCARQKDRVNKALLTEEKMNGILTDMATKQIQLLGSMLKDLAVLQIETGLLPRAPKTVKGMMLGADGKPTHFGWVESDDALLAAVRSSAQSAHEPA